MEHGQEVHHLATVCRASFLVGLWYHYTATRFSFLFSAVECGQPPALTNGRFSAPATTFQSIATYECIRGYEISPEDAMTTRMCQADGVWSTPTNAPFCQCK